MREAECRECNNLFLAHGRERICPDCQPEPEVRDLVDELGQKESRRLARGLNQMNRAGR